MSPPGKSLIYIKRPFKKTSAATRPLLAMQNAHPRIDTNRGSLHPALFWSPETLTLGQFGILDWLAGCDRGVASVIQAGSTPSRPRSLQMAGLPPAPSAAQSPPPTTLSPHRSRVSPRLPHPLRMCGGDATLTPAASSSPGCARGNPEPRYREPRTSSPRPFHHPIQGPSFLPTPTYSTRLGGASSLQSSSRPSEGGPAGKRPRPPAQPRWALAEHAALDLCPKQESGARRAQTLAVGRGDLNLHLFPLPSLTAAPFTPDSADAGRRGATLPRNSIVNC